MRSLRYAELRLELVEEDGSAHRVLRVHRRPQPVVVPLEHEERGAAVGDRGAGEAERRVGGERRHDGRVHAAEHARRAAPVHQTSP